MKTTTVQTNIDLGDEWVDHILVTAFDSGYGSSWYWVNEDDDILTVKFVQSDVPDRVLEGEKLIAAVELTLSEDRLHNTGVWREAVLERSRGVVARLDGTSLSWACGRVLENWRHGETARQLREALAGPDELPDLDGEAADVIVQLALFDQLVYG